MRALLTLLAFMVTYIPSVAIPVTEADVSLMLRRLDRELERRNEYIAGRAGMIDSLLSLLDRPEAPDSLKLSALLKVGDHFNAFNTDSALLFYDRGYRQALGLGYDSTAVRFALRKATFMPLSLLISEGAGLMDSIDRVGVPEGLLPEYFDARRQMYFYISSFFTDRPHIFDRMKKLERDAQHELLGLLDSKSDYYKLNLGESYLYNEEYTSAKAVLDDLLESIDESNPLYARACHMLADIYGAKNDESGRVYYLALSALSDTRCATREVTSLQELGQLLYQRNDINRAHEYLSLALKNAVDCHVALRIIQTSKSIPFIENAHRAEIASSQRRIYVIMAVMAIMLVVLVVAWRMVSMKNGQLHGMANRLEDANKTKDVYIAQFLSLCSIYMDKLNQFNKMVNRKIATGKTDDLFKLTKSGKFVEEQSKEFYDVFDDAFLHIYPSFVEDVNSLLLPDKQIVLKAGERLNTDLRILALMRLGIEETARIAQMLNYSVFTIYTYRNKFKSRAKNRDTFEKDVMAIKSIS